MNDNIRGWRWKCLNLDSCLQCRYLGMKKKISSNVDNLFLTLDLGGQAYCNQYKWSIFHWFPELFWRSGGEDQAELPCGQMDHTPIHIQREIPRCCQEEVIIKIIIIVHNLLKLLLKYIFTFSWKILNVPFLYCRL